MSILDENVIDIVQTHAETQTTRLIIADHLPWGDDTSDNEHLWKLQSKVNDYLKYVESGQLGEDYPDQEGYAIILQVYGKFDRSLEAVEFYDQLKNVLKDAGYGLEFILKA